MFRFESPQYLYLLVAPAVLFLVYLLTRRIARNRRRRLADKELWTRAVPDYSPRRQLTKFLLTLAAMVCLVFMLARPQYGTANVSEEKRGIEAVFVVDVSNSMLAADVQPDRLSRAKLLVSTIIDRMKNDKVALAVFAGEAYPQLPITNDYASAKLFLDNLTTGMVTLQGTNIASAIDLGRSSFTTRKDVGKALIIITDGEDHEEGAIEKAKEAAKEGVKVYMLGVGSKEGAKIPQEGGKFLTDQNGEVVTSALNEQMCRDIAAAGGGKYFHVDNSNAAQEQLQTELATLKQADNSSNFTNPDEQFQAVALLAFLLLLVEFFVLERKNPLFSRLHLFKGKSQTLSLVAIAFLSASLGSLAPQTATAQTREWKLIHEGNKAFNHRQYRSAKSYYGKALKLNPSNTRAGYNLANTEMALGNDSAAAAGYDRVIGGDHSPLIRSMAAHNKGTIFQRQAGAETEPSKKQEKLKAAIAAYQQALRNNPASESSRYNMVLCQKQLRESKNNQNKPKPQQGQQQQQKQKQQQQKNKQQQQPLMNYSKRAEEQTRRKINQSTPQRSLDKNW